jgi:tRNA nucleotidyltransferase (CCA-adding enzyme)
VKEWLAANEAEIMQEATRRLQKAEAASEEKKAAMAVIVHAKQEKQKAEAWALKAARREAALSAGS